MNLKMNFTELVLMMNEKDPMVIDVIDTLTIDQKKSLLAYAKANGCKFYPNNLTYDYQNQVWLI